MKNNKLIMMMGLPASGKSTMSEKLAEKGYIIHSSDSIRLEFGLALDEKEKTFDLLYKRVKEDLIAGKNVIYDATNLVKKNRITFLDTIKDIPCWKECMFFITPVDICKERNSKRTSNYVPEEVYNRMLNSFKPPSKREGFDKIKPIFYDGEIKFDYYLKNPDIFNQENNYSELPIKEQQKVVTKYLADKYSLNETDLRKIDENNHNIGMNIFANTKDDSAKETSYFEYNGNDAYTYLCLWLSKCKESERYNKFFNALHVSRTIGWSEVPLREIKENENIKDISDNTLSNITKEIDDESFILNNKNNNENTSIQNNQQEDLNSSINDKEDIDVDETDIEEI